MPTLGPQIVTGSYGNLLKFIDIGEDGVETGQIRISDGKGKPTPLFLATGSAYVSGTLSASAEVIFDGLTSNAPGHYVSFDTSNGRLYYSTTSSLQVTSASYAVSASFAPDDGDWTIGSTFMTASGQTSIVIGNKLENGLRNHAQGGWSHAEGADTVASGSYSHAEGRNVSSSGAWSHAEGNETKAQQNYSHAEGDGTVSYGLGAHAEGYQTLASGTYSHAEGEKTLAKSIGSHTEGIFTTASALYAHAEGKGGVASGEISHAEGHYTVASGWHSHAEGNETTSSGQGSHAEGYKTKATNIYAHAEGQSSKANGRGSHAEGKKTTAQADNSHAGGLGTWANKEDQTVVGQFNVFNQALGPFHDSTFVVGTGTSDSQRADGLIVKRNTHEVAVMQQASQEYPALSDQNGPGLYFGKPETPYSNRIVSFEGLVPGAMIFQFHDGVNYTDMVQVGGGAAVFVPDP